MAYYDIVRASQLYGNVLRGSQYDPMSNEMLYQQPRNPYRGSSYLNAQDFKNIYLENPMPQNPFTLVPDVDDVDPALRLSRGLQFGMTGASLGSTMKLGSGVATSGFGTPLGLKSSPLKLPAWKYPKWMGSKAGQPILGKFSGKSIGGDALASTWGGSGLGGQAGAGWATNYMTAAEMASSGMSAEAITLAQQNMAALQAQGVSGATAMAGQAGAGATQSWAGKFFGSGNTVVPGLALGALAYGLTRDDNPYSYSQKEKIGGLAAGGITGGLSLTPLLAINPLLGVGLGLLGGHFLNKAGEKKAAKLSKEHTEEYVEGVKEVQEERAEGWAEKQEELEKEQKMQAYMREANLYDNQYGAYMPQTGYMEENPYAAQSRYV